MYADPLPMQRYEIRLFVFCFIRSIISTHTSNNKATNASSSSRANNSRRNSGYSKLEQWYERGREKWYRKQSGKILKISASHDIRSRGERKKGSARGDRLSARSVPTSKTDAAPRILRPWAESRREKMQNRAGLIRAPSAIPQRGATRRDARNTSDKI